MGHKVNPKILRMNINTSALSSWYAKNNAEYRKFVYQDAMIREFVNKKMGHAGLGNININRVSATRLVLILEAARPGLIIGHHGKDIDKLRDELKAKFSDLPEISINVVEIRNPDAHPLCVANKIAQQLVARGSWRKAMKSALSFGMRGGLRGMTVICGGRLSAIARTEKKSEGSVSLSTFRDDIRSATVPAITRSGKIGVRVIMSYGSRLNRTKSGIPAIASVSDGAQRPTGEGRPRGPNNRNFNKRRPHGSERVS